MREAVTEKDWKSLEDGFKGEIKRDDLHRRIYATDASVYRRVPQAVAYPKNEEDISRLMDFARKTQTGIIPRTAGTSLAGQCVGEGIVMDVSRHFTRILDFDPEKKQIWVEPGVIRDDLNRFLKPHGLFFGPNTSTANRCMIGGMLGNNSSGTTSIRYGVTRDKVVSVKTLLADGSQVEFKSVSKAEWKKRSEQENREGELYRRLEELLGEEETQTRIRENFPKPEIHRRNTGYAIDELLDTEVFSASSQQPAHLGQLLAGSEGTLAITLAVCIQLDPLPPVESAMVVTHYHSLQACLHDVKPLMSHHLYTCEMMDKIILDCTKNNIEQAENRKFVEGDPAALLMLELRADSRSGLDEQIAALQSTIQDNGHAYASPVLFGEEVNKALSLRKAGLGLLGNIVGDRKAVACIEDTAVALEDLHPFIDEFASLMEDFGQEAVYYAHAGAGELHLRPILNLKESADVALFRQITQAVAELTKKYQGSFSGEHGDGIVRAEFIPLMIGEENYELLREVKRLFDPLGILNPGKIVDPYPMDKALRYEVDRQEPEVQSFLDFSDSLGIVRATEKCNGSGDCRKSAEAAGAMCPSYQATREEKDSTRARANALREYLTEQNADQEELKEVLDLCISCKACARECPSNVDMAVLKSEVQFQYQESKGYSTRSKAFAYSTTLNRMASRVPFLSNTLYKNPLSSGLIKKVNGIAPKRKLPLVHKLDFEKLNKRLKAQFSKTAKKEGIVLYVDEFTRYMDTQIGQEALELLWGLGYSVEVVYGESGRTFLSKGFLRQAKRCAEENLKTLTPYLEQGKPILGVEPSALLSFRDEYNRFGLLSEQVQKLANNSFLVEEFLAKQLEAGHMSPEQFTSEEKEIQLHVHCHQKALSDSKVSCDVLGIPANYKVRLMPTGCCGMAGSFGYEKEHYEVSMKIGELKLFPRIRKLSKEVIVAANGTSCRHQIEDGTGRLGLHPIQILNRALV